MNLDQIELQMPLELEISQNQTILSLILAQQLPLTL